MNKLNKKELQYIINEVSNSLLNEIKVMDAYQKYYSDVPSYVWEEIIGRLQKDRNGNFVNDLLPETKWVLKLYKAKSPRLVEDLYKLKNENGDGYLDIFLRAKERRMIQGVDGDLNRFKSIAELGAYVSSLDVDNILGRTKGEMSNAVHEAKDDIEKLYEDDEWIILIPKTHEASCYWAKGAHWCTAYRDSDDYFNEYSSQGPLFMNINKENPQLSTQFHIESEQYMDYYDNAIEEPIFEQIHDGDTLLDFYQGYLPAKKFIKMVGSELGNGLYAAYLYDYDYGEDGHDNEYAYFMVDINMNRIAGPFEDMYNFIGNNVTRVIYNDSKYNLVDTKGNLQFDEPLLDIRVCGDNKNKFIGKTCNSSSMDDEGNITIKETTHVVTYDNGEIQHFPQYDYYTFYHEGFSIVRGKDNFNVLNVNFQPIFKKDYLYIKPFSSDRKQYFAIQKMNKWNLSDMNGNILWDNWVYDITPNLTINGLPIRTFKVNTGIGFNLYDVNGNPMMGEDVEKFTWSNWKTDGVVSGVMMLNGDYNFLDNKFNIIDRDGKILYKGLYEPMNESRRILNEITVQDASKRFYSDIPANDFMEIINTLQSGNQILLPDTKWALSLYKRKSPRFMEDLYKLHNENGDGYLDIFNRLKTINKIQGTESDLGRYKSISELGAFINAKMNELGDEEIWGDNAYRKKKNMSDEVKSAKDDIKVLYEDDTWLILTPNSYEASVYWGNGTEWCTAYKDDRKYYDRYSKEGILYININKETGEKYQFHFETSSFMDADDSEINYDDTPVFDNINGVTKGMVDYYEKILNSDNFELLTGYNEYGTKVSYDPEKQAYYLEKRGYDKPFSEYYDMIQDFCDGYAVVYKDDINKYNYISSKGKLLSETWFDDCKDFSYGYAPVSFGKNQWNYITTEGKFLLKKNVHQATHFMPCGLGRIIYDEKWNIVDGDGKILSKIWFDEIGYCFSNYNIIRVKLHNKFNFIRKDGSLITDKWWDMASKHVVDYFDFAVSNKSDGIIFYVNAENGEITKSDDTIHKQSELSQRAFWENTNKLDINDIHYIINETKNRLLLNEISNNAIETLFKKYLPWISEIFDLTLEQVKNLGKRPEDTRKNVYGIQGMTYCRELGIDYDDDIMINPDMKIKDWLRLKIMKEFEINRGRGPIQYIRGIIRICCSDEDIQLFSRNDYDVNKKTTLNLKKFKQIIGYINNNNLEFNEDLNGLSFRELNRNIGFRLRHDAYHNWLTNKEKAVKNQQIGEYTVIPMYGFEDTSKYSQYTEWCVTQTFSAYRQYTDDGSQFFFCLKNGFENITRKRGEDCPFDEYGLSMVSVLIYPNGEIKHVTTRWNHDHGGEDNPNLHTFEQIESVLGIPENAFLTHTRPELELDDIPDMIKKYGADNILTFVDNDHGCQIVKYNDKFNVIHNDILLSEQWFDSIQASTEKFFVCINYTEGGWRYNIIDERGLVFPENFSHANFQVFNQEKGIYAIYMSGDCALYQRGSNEPISEKFSKIEGLKDNYARAQLYNTYNFFDENGKKMWDEWKNLIIKPTDVWHEGFQLIYDSQGRCNYINIKTGDILSNEWLYDGDTFYEGFATVKNKKGETNFLKVDGTLLSDIWYDTMIRCGEYFAVGTKGVEMTFLDKNGDVPIHKTWKHAIAFNGEYGLIRNDDNEKVTTIINRNGNEVADIDLNCFSITKNNVIIAFNAQYKVTLVTIDGEYLLPPDLSFVGHKNHKDNCVYLKDEKTDKVYEFNVQTSEITDVTENL